MNFPFTKEQKLIAESARDFARQYLEPLKAELDAKGQYPAAVVAGMAEMGFFGVFLPADDGGAEAGYLSFALMVEELSRVCAAAAAVVAAHGVAAYAIHRWGSTAQKETYLPALATGERIAAFAVHAPATDARPATLTAAANHAFTLNGRKAYVGNAGVAQVYVVAARRSPAGVEAGPGAETSALCTVDAHASGITVTPSAANMGLHGFPTGEVAFENVAVAASEILLGPDSAADLVPELLAVKGLADAAQTIGIAQAAIEEAAQYSTQRVQFGQPIGNFEAIQSLLAEMVANCYLARLAAYDVARRMDAGERFLAEAAMLKSFAARMGQQALLNAVQVEGGIGFMEDAPLARMYRDVWGTTIVEHPDEFPEKVVSASLR